MWMCGYVDVWICRCVTDSGRVLRRSNTCYGLSLCAMGVKYMLPTLAVYHGSQTHATAAAAARWYQRCGVCEFIAGSVACIPCVPIQRVVSKSPHMIYYTDRVPRSNGIVVTSSWSTSSWSASSWSASSWSASSWSASSWWRHHGLRHHSLRHHGLRHF